MFDGLRSILVALIVAAAAIACSVIGAGSLVDVFRIRHQDHRITVTGSATRRIRSDLIVWDARVRSQAADMASAYKKLATDVPQVTGYIKSKGIDEKTIKVSSTSIREVHPRDREGHELPETVISYVLEQTIEVTSSEIDKVEQVSRGATELLDRGIYVHSEVPDYIYTKLAELKIQMLSDAARDAKQRAEQIANSSESHLAGLVAARMGVMQVNPANATEVSAEGNNDKTTLEKDVLAVVTSTFAIR